LQGSIFDHTNIDMALISALNNMFALFVSSVPSFIPKKHLVALVVVIIKYKCMTTRNVITYKDTFLSPGAKLG
jgi:hypothetical protein